MTSTGKLKACLCYADTISVFEAARHGSEEEIRKCLEQAIRGKPKMHHFEEQNFITEQKNSHRSEDKHKNGKTEGNLHQ